jgi:F0F1-type ATP synthase epsilon subunit
VTKLWPTPKADEGAIGSFGFLKQHNPDLEEINFGKMSLRSRADEHSKKLTIALSTGKL